MISMNFELHPFHIVEESPWPVIMSLVAFNTLINLVFFAWKMQGVVFFFFNLILGGLILSIWGGDVTKESSLIGFHTHEIESSLKWSIGWFILREIFFFVSFFWAFFTLRLRSTIELGERWPPFLIEPTNPFSIPLLNTLILLRSGVRLTWAHHSIIEGDYLKGTVGLGITILLGFYFTLLQVMEYFERSFRFNDSLYGRVFFLSTGFHGAHVAIGTSLLILCFLRLVLNQHFRNHHMGLEARRWYWHFVDVVWLFLFTFIYWWGR